MQMLVGLYIEDEPKNVTIMKGRFSLYQGINLIGLDSYPRTLNGFYDIVIEHNVDFLLVDHELDKALVDYKGIDVLREVRKHDSHIYAVLLTNYNLYDYRDELGEYDFQLNKEVLSKPEKMKELVAKIKRGCGLRQDNALLLSMDEKQNELQNLLWQMRTALKKD